MMKKYILLLISALCLFSACQEELIGVSSVAVDKERQDLSIGASFVLKAIISPSNADNQKIIWTVENSSVVDYVDNQDGSATIKGLKVGTSKVTARTDDGGFMSSCNVTVGVGVEKIELDKSELSLKKESPLPLRPPYSLKTLRTSPSNGVPLTFLSPLLTRMAMSRRRAMERRRFCLLVRRRFHGLLQYQGRYFCHRHQP